MDNVLKWSATSILVFGTIANSFNLYPLGPLLGLTGSIIWLTVAIRWRENSLIVLNSVMALAGLVGLVYTYMK
jgi:hypothetical protein